MTRASLNSEALPIRRAPGRPRDDSLRERRCEEILAQATSVFAEHGYPNTDVQFIADPLGISKGTIYRYFPSKEVLFLAAVERGVTGLSRHVDSMIESIADPLEVMAKAMRAYLEFFQRNPALIELFIQERAEFRDRRKPIYFEHGCETECKLNELLGGLIKAGRLRNVPLERIHTVIGDVLYGTMLSNHFDKRERSLEAQAADVVDVIFNGLLSDSERAARRGANGGNGHAPRRTGRRAPARGKRVK
jgi:AcrR family transcriptional regulator